MNLKKKLKSTMAVILAILAISATLVSCDDKEESSSLHFGSDAGSESQVISDDKTDDDITESDEVKSETENTSDSTVSEVVSDETSNGSDENKSEAASGDHQHSFNQWTETKAPTCSENGEKTRICGCGVQETESIPSVSHTEVEDKAVEATCKETGLTAGKHCSVCNTVIVAQEKTETVSHDYKNGTCRWCGDDLYNGTIKILNIPDLKELYSSNRKVLDVSTENGAAMFDINGKRISDYYDYVQCPSEEGYCVATNIVEKPYMTTYCDMCEMDETFYKKIYYTYVLDSKGKVIYESVGERIELEGHDIEYTGEIIEDCRGGRIITTTYNKYWLGLAVNDCTLHIYDLNGKKICDLEEVVSFGSYTKDTIIICGYDGVSIYDKQFNLIIQKNVIDVFYNPEIATGVHTSYFVNGYITISNECGNNSYLISENLKTVYTLNKEYYTGLNYGTLIFSKIKENNGYSDEYYLIDVSKCKTDEDGVIIPSKNAAICSTAFKNGYISNLFGKEEKYFLVNTTDGKWGYISTNGKILKTYDDATNFRNGIAAVKEGNEIYVINENFERISSGIKGYDSVSTAGEGIFVLKNGDKTTVAVYSK